MSDPKRKEIFGLHQITKKRLKELCKQNKLYQTPHLNDQLYLHFQGFQAIENLEEYTGLKCLWLESNAISEIQGLGCQTALRCLFLQNNLIKKIENLESCRDLDTLNLSSNHIVKIENCGVDILPVLSTLILSHNYIKNYAGLENLINCTGIWSLDLAHNRIDDILVVKIFGQMPALRVLVLVGNPVVSKVPQYRKTLILECKNLTYLDTRPVFPKDRACAEAWKRGGHGEERREHDRWVRREQRKMRESINATLRLRIRHGDTTVSLIESTDTEGEKDDADPERASRTRRTTEPVETNSSHVPDLEITGVSQRVDVSNAEDGSERTSVYDMITMARDEITAPLPDDILNSPTPSHRAEALFQNYVDEITALEAASGIPPIVVPDIPTAEANHLAQPIELDVEQELDDKPSRDVNYLNTPKVAERHEAVPLIPSPRADMEVDGACVIAETLPTEFDLETVTIENDEIRIKPEKPMEQEFKLLRADRVVMKANSPFSPEYVAWEDPRSSSSSDDNSSSCSDLSFVESPADDNELPETVEVQTAPMEFPELDRDDGLPIANNDLEPAKTVAVNKCETQTLVKKNTDKEVSTDESDVEQIQERMRRTRKLKKYSHSFGSAKNKYAIRKPPSERFYETCLGNVFAPSDLLELEFSDDDYFDMYDIPTSESSKVPLQAAEEGNANEQEDNRVFSSQTGEGQAIIPSTIVEGVSKTPENVPAMISEGTTTKGDPEVAAWLQRCLSKTKRNTDKMKAKETNVEDLDIAGTEARFNEFLECMANKGEGNVSDMIPLNVPASLPPKEINPNELTPRTELRLREETWLEEVRASLRRDAVRLGLKLDLPKLHVLPRDEIDEPDGRESDNEMFNSNLGDQNPDVNPTSEQDVHSNASRPDLSNANKREPAQKDVSWLQDFLHSLRHEDHEITPQTVETTARQLLSEQSRDLMKQGSNAYKEADGSTHTEGEEIRKSNSTSGSTSRALSGSREESIKPYNDEEITEVNNGPMGLDNSPSGSFDFCHIGNSSKLTSKTGSESNITLSNDSGLSLNSRLMARTISESNVTLSNDSDYSLTMDMTQKVDVENKAPLEAPPGMLELDTKPCDSLTCDSTISDEGKMQYSSGPDPSEHWTKRKEIEQGIEEQRHEIGSEMGDEKTHSSVMIPLKLIRKEREGDQKHDSDRKGPMAENESLKSEDRSEDECADYRNDTKELCSTDRQDSLKDNSVALRERMIKSPVQVVTEENVSSGKSHESGKKEDMESMPIQSDLTSQDVTEYDLKILSEYGDYTDASASESVRKPLKRIIIGEGLCCRDHSTTDSGNEENLPSITGSIHQPSPRNSEEDNRRLSNAHGYQQEQRKGQNLSNEELCKFQSPNESEEVIPTRNPFQPMGRSEIEDTSQITETTVSSRFLRDESNIFSDDTDDEVYDKYFGEIPNEHLRSPIRVRKIQTIGDGTFNKQNRSETKCKDIGKEHTIDKPKDNLSKSTFQYPNENAPGLAIPVMCNVQKSCQDVSRAMTSKAKELCRANFQSPYDARVQKDGLKNEQSCEEQNAHLKGTADAINILFLRDPITHLPVEPESLDVRSLTEDVTKNQLFESEGIKGKAPLKEEDNNIARTQPKSDKDEKKKSLSEAAFLSQENTQDRQTETTTFPSTAEEQPRNLSDSESRLRLRDIHTNFLTEAVSSLDVLDKSMLNDDTASPTNQSETGNQLECPPSTTGSHSGTKKNTTDEVEDEPSWWQKTLEAARRQQKEEDDKQEAATTKEEGTTECESNVDSKSDSEAVTKVVATSEEVKAAPNHDPEGLIAMRKRVANAREMLATILSSTREYQRQVLETNTRPNTDLKNALGISGVVETPDKNSKDTITDDETSEEDEPPVAETTAGSSSCAQTVREVLTTFNEVAERLTKKRLTSDIAVRLYQNPLTKTFSGESAKEINRQYDELQEKRRQWISGLVDKVYALKDEYENTIDVVDGRLMIIRKGTGELQEVNVPPSLEDPPTVSCGIGTSHIMHVSTGVGPEQQSSVSDEDLTEISSEEEEVLPDEDSIGRIMGASQESVNTSKVFSLPEYQAEFEEEYGISSDGNPQECSTLTTDEVFELHKNIDQQFFHRVCTMEDASEYLVSKPPLPQIKGNEEDMLLKRARLPEAEKADPRDKDKSPQGNTMGTNSDGIPADQPNREESRMDDILKETRSGESEILRETGVSSEMLQNSESGLPLQTTMGGVGCLLQNRIPIPTNKGVEGPEEFRCIEHSYGVCDSEVSIASETTEDVSSDKTSIFVQDPPDKVTPLPQSHSQTKSENDVGPKRLIDIINENRALINDPLIYHFEREYTLNKILSETDMIPNYDISDEETKVTVQSQVENQETTSLQVLPNHRDRETKPDLEIPLETSSQEVMKNLSHSKLSTSDWYSEAPSNLLSKPSDHEADTEQFHNESASNETDPSHFLTVGTRDKESTNTDVADSQMVPPHHATGQAVNQLQAQTELNDQKNVYLTSALESSSYENEFSRQPSYFIKFSNTNSSLQSTEVDLVRGAEAPDREETPEPLKDFTMEESQIIYTNPGGALSQPVPATHEDFECDSETWEIASDEQFSNPSPHTSSKMECTRGSTRRFESLLRDYSPSAPLSIKYDSVIRGSRELVGKLDIIYEEEEPNGEAESVVDKTLRQSEEVPLDVVVESQTECPKTDDPTESTSSLNTSNRQEPIIDLQEDQEEVNYNFPTHADEAKSEPKMYTEFQVAEGEVSLSEMFGSASPFTDSNILSDQEEEFYADAESGLEIPAPPTSEDGFHNSHVSSKVSVAIDSSKVASQDLQKNHIEENSTEQIHIALEVINVKEKPQSETHPGDGASSDQSARCTVERPSQTNLEKSTDSSKFIDNDTEQDVFIKLNQDAQVILNQPIREDLAQAVKVFTDLSDPNDVTFEGQLLTKISPNTGTPNEQDTRQNLSPTEVNESESSQCTQLPPAEGSSAGQEETSVP